MRLSNFLTDSKNTRTHLQALLPALGFQPLPAEVLAYANLRALPLLMPDTRTPYYVFETVATSYSGAASNVVSAFGDSYVRSTVLALQSKVTALQVMVLSRQRSVSSLSTNIFMS